MEPALRSARRDRIRHGWRDLAFFLRFARPAWKIGAAGLLLNLVIAAGTSLVPLSGKVIIDALVLGRGLPELESAAAGMGIGWTRPALEFVQRSAGALVLALLAAGLAVGAAEIGRRWLTLKFQQEMATNLQTSLFGHLLGFPLAFFRRSQTGYLVSRVSDDVELVEYVYAQGFSQLATGALQLLFGGGILVGLSPRLGLAAAMSLPAYLLVNRLFAGRIRRVSTAEREEQAQVGRHLQEVLSGVEVVKAHAAEEREVSRVSVRIRSLARARLRSAVLSFASSWAARGVQFAFTLLVMWIGVAEMKGGRMTVGDYVAFTTYMVYLTGVMRGLSSFHLMVQPMMASADRLLEIFRMAPEGAGDPSAGAGEPPRGGVDFDRVSFAYEDGRAALHDVSLRVRPGEVVALVGPSGAGKTTLINLLLKFYRPSAGAIRLDGRDLGELDTRRLRGRIGIVSQDVFLFNDTVEHNIRYGRPAAAREEVVEAARRAGVHEDIARLPQGYDTVVGERGILLSAGQRQRLSIARAFLRDPAILILDEPTSSLDPASEELVKDSLRSLVRGRTVFIISHRRTLDELAGAIVRLEGGRVTSVRRVGGQS